MAALLTPDICVIGGGSGGLTVAAAAAAFGVPVVLVEKGKMGGDCLNYGCVPSKALIAAGRRAQVFRSSCPFGIETAAPAIDFAGVHRHVHEVIAAIAPNDSVERFEGLGVEVIRAEARFTDPRTVAAGERLVRARRFVIATGSAPAVPPVEGLSDIPYLTNETVFDLVERPGHLLVLGGGPIGMELAQAFRRLGSAVTVVEAAAPLAREDPELAAEVLGELEREGVSIRAGAEVVRAEKLLDGVRLVLDGPAETAIDGTHLLIATGRRASIEELGLDLAGIEHDAKGIAVDAGLRTSNRRVYAVGDVAGGPQFTHLAGYHAGLVVRNALFRIPVRVRPEIVPRVTYTDPEIAAVGLTEAEARKSADGVQVLRWPYRENDRAQTERATRGLIKVVVDRRGRVLGAGIAGEKAGDLILLWAYAAQKRLGIRELTGLVVPYPTLGEIGRRAAIAYYAPALTNRWIRRIIAGLRRLG